MPFSQLDSAGIARALSQIAERPADLADAFFERSEVIELPPDYPQVRDAMLREIERRFGA